MNRLLLALEVLSIVVAAIGGAGGDHAGAAWGVALACYLHLVRKESEA